MSTLLKKLIMIALALPTLAMAQEVSLDKVVATVAGEPITAQEVNDQTNLNIAIAKNAAAAENQKLADPSKKELQDMQTNAFNEIIDNRLMMNKARSLGINITNADVSRQIDKIAQEQGLTTDVLKQSISSRGPKAWEIFNRDLRTDMTRGELINREIAPKVTVSPAEVDALLAKNKMGSGNPLPKATAIEARHIYILGTDANAKARAEAAKIRLKTESFEYVAKAVSDDKATANDGGKMPPFALNKTTDPVIRKAIEATNEGGITDVLKGENGYQIFKIEKKSEVEFSLEDQKKTATNALKQQKVAEAYTKWLNNLALTSKSLVEIKK